MILLKLSEEEKEVIQFMFRQSKIDSLHPEVQKIAMNIKAVLDNPRKISSEEEYKELFLSPVWKSCENCDE